MFYFECRGHWFIAFDDCIGGGECIWIAGINNLANASENYSSQAGALVHYVRLLEIPCDIPPEAGEQSLILIDQANSNLCGFK